MRRHPKRFLMPPVDPRMRRVEKSERLGRGGGLALTLECGHIERRRFICVPHSIICAQCPPAGGLGGRGFEQ